MRSVCFEVAMIAVALPVAVALDNGLVRVPWMGFSAWEVFRDTTPQQDPHHSLSESLIRETADAMVEGGFAEAGYTIVWIDDAWAAKDRSADGALVPDPARWPNGMKAVGDYLHSRGLLLGLYGDIGTRTCAGYPGLKRPDGDFSRDAEQLASWGVDAFKVDGCNADPKTMDETYPALGRALNATGRPMIYSCSWPDYERSSSYPINFTKVRDSCNSWRIFWDVQAGQYANTQAARFDCVAGYLEFAASGSTEQASPFSPSCPGDWRSTNHPAPIDVDSMRGAAGPGGFNDADMLPIGVNYTMSGGRVVPVKAFTPTQARSAFALWVVLASPLMIGADVRTMDPDSKSVWLNRGLIAAHQDPLGKQGVRIRGNATAPQVWKRELVNNSLLVVVYIPDVAPLRREPPAWSGPYALVYSDAQCPNVGNHGQTSVSGCKVLCEVKPGCDAFNYGEGGCSLRACPANQLSNPSWADPNTTSYRMANAPAPPGPPLPTLLTVGWGELDLAPSAKYDGIELISNTTLGVLTGSFSVNLSAGASAAVHLSPHL